MLTVPVVLAAIVVFLAASPAAARSPLLLGVSMDGSGRDLGQLDQFHADIGEWPALWTVWSQWGSRGGKSACQPGHGTCAFPSETLAQLGARDPDIIPVIWWEPWNPGRWTPTYARYQRILNGKHDAYIKKWAEDARDHGGRVILRFAHEANGHWFPWGIGNFDNSASTFKAAWRYVWRKFQDVGADNVEFLWSVTNQSCPSCNPFAEVFPGNKYVDWVGITAFNWGAQRSWQSMIAILEKPIKSMRQVTKKSVIVSELASHYRPTSKSKAKWIRRGYQDVYDRWPFIKAVMYLNAVGPKVEFGHPDWRLVKPNDGSALQAYSEIAAMAKFQGSLPPS